MKLLIFFIYILIFSATPGILCASNISDIIEGHREKIEEWRKKSTAQLMELDKKFLELDSPEESIKNTAHQELVHFLGLKGSPTINELKKFRTFICEELQRDTLKEEFREKRDQVTLEIFLDGIWNLNKQNKPINITIHNFFFQKFPHGLCINYVKSWEKISKTTRDDYFLNGVFEEDKTRDKAGKTYRQFYWDKQNDGLGIDEERIDDKSDSDSEESSTESSISPRKNNNHFLYIGIPIIATIFLGLAVYAFKIDLFLKRIWKLA